MPGPNPVHGPGNPVHCPQTATAGGRRTSAGGWVTLTAATHPPRSGDGPRGRPAGAARGSCGGAAPHCCDPQTTAGESRERVNAGTRKTLESGSARRALWRGTWGPLLADPWKPCLPADPWRLARLAGRGCMGSASGCSHGRFRGCCSGLGVAGELPIVRVRGRVSGCLDRHDRRSMRRPSRLMPGRSCARDSPDP